MTEEEKETWISFKEILLKFSGNQRDINLKEIVKKLLLKFHDLWCSMILKVHFLHSHFDYLPETWMQ